MGKSLSNLLASAVQQSGQQQLLNLTLCMLGMHSTNAGILNDRNCEISASPDRLSSTYARDTRLASSLQCCAAKYNQPPATTHNAPGSDKYAFNSSRSRLVIAAALGTMHKLQD